MNVLVLAEAFLPRAGGSRVYYFNLYKHLLQHFPDKVTVLTRKVPGWQEFDARQTPAGLRIERHSDPLDSWNYFDLASRASVLFGQTLSRVVRGHFDLLHCGDLFPQGIVSRALKMLTGLPYLVYCHGEEITQTNRYRAEVALRNSIYRAAGALVVNSQFTRIELLKVGIPESNIHMVTPGVDTERFQPAPPDPALIQRFGLAGKTVLLTVGRLVQRKGHALVLRALARLRAQHPELHYLIAGIGPEEQNLRRLCDELGLANNVTFVGPVSDQDLSSYYALCDIFVMANIVVLGDTEGFGMVFLEANAVGKPVIGGREGGTEDSIVDGTTGFRVRPEDVGELARAISVLAEDPIRRQTMGRAGLDRVRADFQWSARGTRLREISLELLTRQRRVRKGQDSNANATLRS